MYINPLASRLECYTYAQPGLTISQQNGYDSVYCKISEQFYDRELTLPIHYKVSDNDLDYIVETVKRLLKEGNQ